MTDLLDIAKGFVKEKFAGCRGILGVLLTGSSVDSPALFHTESGDCANCKN